MLSRLGAVAAVTAVLLTGCGGVSDEALTTLAPTQATEFVVVEVSTTTTVPATTAAPYNATDPSLPASGTIPPSTVTPTSAGMYVIAEGDSLASIALKHGLSIESLIAINGWTDGIDHVLLPGASIRVAASTPGTSSAPTTAGGGNTGSGCTYTIKESDTPWSVAKKFDITLAELQSANTGGVMDSFLLGATLKIPSNGNC